MTDYANIKLWCVVDEDRLKETKGNIEGHVWRNEEQAYTQADQLAAGGSSAIVFKLEPILVAKISGVIREKILKIEKFPEFNVGKSKTVSVKTKPLNSNYKSKALKAVSVRKRK